MMRSGMRKLPRWRQAFETIDKIYGFMGEKIKLILDSELKICVVEADLEMGSPGLLRKLSPKKKMLWKLQSTGERAKMIEGYLPLNKPK